jgi:hypothetical protein
MLACSIHEETDMLQQYNTTVRKVYFQLIQPQDIKMFNLATKHMLKIQTVNTKLKKH